MSWSPGLSYPYHFLTLLLIGKQRPASLIHHGNNRVLDLALSGYGVKLRFDHIDPINRRHLILLLHPCLDRSGRDKDLHSLLPESLYQGAVTELGNHTRVAAMFIQPAVDA